MTFTADVSPRPVRALVADDERLMREQLCLRLTEVWPELDICAQAPNGQEAVTLCATLRPDVVFLDIRMPGLTGVQAAQAIVEACEREQRPCPELVFITAYDQYAVQAFEQGATDYVLKPVEVPRLALTMQRVRTRLAQRSQASAPAAPSAEVMQLLQSLARQVQPAKPAYLEWLQVTVGQQLLMVSVDEVLFFVSDEKYTRVQTATTSALIRKPIKELIDELDPAKFWQIHRSTLVNVKAIAGVSRDIRGRQLVAVRGSHEKLEVSRSFTQLFKGM